jgi:hypothetical protein
MSKSRWIYRGNKVVGRETRTDRGCTVRQKAWNTPFGHQAGRVTSHTCRGSWRKN